MIRLKTIPSPIKWILLFVLVSTVVWQVQLIVRAEKDWKGPFSRFGSQDLIALWAGSQIYLKGGNPYDIVQILDIQRTIDPGRESPQVFLNPP